MKLTHIYTAFILIFSLFLQTSSVFASEDIEEENYDFYYQDFVVSAYYSPLPNQSRYLRANYEAEIRLNGRGTNGADGTAVFDGMIAAPKSYSFGTKIEIPGLGIGAVHDRGGAIVEKQNYHRIDVWMGHGDVGLTRALNWGMQHITAKVYFDKNALDTNLNYHHISGVSPQATQAKKVQKKADILSKTLSEGMLDKQVVILKELLSSLGFFSLETQNNYFDSELEKAVIRFQIDQKILANNYDYGAGVVGLKTRAALEKIVKEKSLVVSSPQQQKEEVQVAIQRSLSKNSEGEDVKNLQMILSNMGYFYGAITGLYNKDTIDAVFLFQKDNNIVKGSADLGAGNFGPKTRKALQGLLAQRAIDMKNLPMVKSEIFEGDEKNTEVQEKHFILSQSSITSYPAMSFAVFPQSGSQLALLP